MAYLGVSGGGPLWLGALAVVAIAVGIVALIPTMFGVLLAGWVAISVPVGIAVGHCALDREDK